MKISNIDVPYAQVPNRVLFDARLSWKAKGIWAYIQAKPNDWDFSSERMAGDSIDGVKATRSGIDELIQSGYLVAKRLKSGRMSYFLTEKAKVEKSHSAETAQRQKGTGIKERVYTKKESNKETKASPFVWADYLEEMYENKDRAISIIAHFFEYKKLSFDTIDKARVAIKRYIKVARDVSKFDDDEIVKATEKAKRDYGDKMTVETILKVLTK